MQSTKRSVFPLKKSIALIMALSVLVCGVFAACSSKKTDGQNAAADTTQAGLANADTEFGTEINKDGKEVDVVYEKDKKGKNHAYEINKNGEKVTNSNGDYVEVPIEDDNNNNGNNNNGKENGNGGNNNGGNGNENLKPNPVTPQEPDNKGETTGKELTTIEASKDKVPSTNASGKKVIFNVFKDFSQQDLERIAAMLEVPGLYKFSYENKDGVSAEMATHVAVWMAAREDIKGTSFPSGTIVLDLFKYYGQTVVNFKSNCNAAAKKENIYDIISYSNKDSVFTYPGGKHSSGAEDAAIVATHLGNNNYYKVTGSVSGAKSCKKVVAVVQKNRLDTELGFSIKALKWS